MRGFWLPVLLIFLLGRSWADNNLDVKIDGDSSFHSRELLENLPDMPEKLSETLVKNWAEDASYSVETYYRQSGFLQIKIASQVLAVKDAKNSWQVLLHVKEGKRYGFGKVRIVVEENPDTNSEANLPREKLHALQGKPYVEEELSLDQRLLTRFFGNSGFVHAKVTQETVPRDSIHLVDVTYRVKRGHAAVFDTLLVNIRRAPPADSVKGLTHEALLRSLIPYHHGDTLRIDQNDRVIEKLQSTGLYNSVRLEDSATSGNVMILDVEEKVPGHLNTSLFYETQYGFGVSGTVVHSNIAGSLKEVRLGSIFAQNKQSFSAGFGSPLLWGMLLRFDDNMLVEWYQDKLPGYPFFEGDYHASNTASLSRAFFYWLRGVSSVELNYLSQLVVDTGSGFLTREKAGTFNLINTAFLSFVDQDLNPSRGTRYAITWGNGGPVDGLDVFHNRANWLEVKSAYYYYLPPWNQFKVAFRLDGGRFFATAGANANRFFLGGARSVRSYGFAQICPDAPSPLIGSCPIEQEALQPAYFLVSAELRLSPFDFSLIDSRGFTKYLKPLGVVPFVDFGKVWNTLGGERFSFTREFFSSGNGRGIAYGGGLRYPLLGIFNLRLDFAWGRAGGGSWPDEWLIDLAQAF